MSQKHGGAYFMGQGPSFAAHAGPWHPDPGLSRRDFRNPVPLGLILGQAASPAVEASTDEPFTLPLAVSREWADRVDGYLLQVQEIQDYVRANPTEAAASGLAREAAALPPTGDLAAWPKLKAVYDKLRGGLEVTEAELDLIPALGTALVSANQKLAALRTTLLTPLNIAVGAGVIALAAGLLLL
jgi:hypothetical protein